MWISILSVVSCPRKCKIYQTWTNWNIQMSEIINKKCTFLQHKWVHCSAPCLGYHIGFIMFIANLVNCLHTKICQWFGRHRNYTETHWLTQNVYRRLYAFTCYQLHQWNLGLKSNHVLIKDAICLRSQLLCLSNLYSNEMGGPNSENFGTNFNTTDCSGTGYYRVSRLYSQLFVCGHTVLRHLLM